MSTLEVVKSQGMMVVARAQENTCSIKQQIDYSLAAK
jgi:hypothetical protein